MLLAAANYCPDDIITFDYKLLLNTNIDKESIIKKNILENKEIIFKKHFLRENFSASV